MPGVWQLDEPAYDPAHAPTMVICCSDGRFVEATQDFLRSQRRTRHDLVAIPGGMAEALYEHDVPGAAMSGAQATQLLAKLHRTRRIVLLAHADCGYYIHRLGASDPDRQKEDLGRAAEWLVERVPDVTVEAYFIRPAEESEGQGFIFEEV